MNKKINVLFLSDHLGHTEGRIHGATSYFLSVLPRINRSVVNLTVCFLREYHESAELLKAEGITPIFLNKKKWDFSVVFDLIRMIRARNIHIVHAAGMKGILTGRAAARICGVKAIVHFHDMAEQSLPIRFLQRLTASWTDCALAISEAVRNFCVVYFRIPAGRAKTLYNGIDLTRFAPLSSEKRRAVRTSLGLSPDDHIIISIGRLDAVKNQAETIQVLKEVSESVNDTKLLIIGAGTMEMELKELVEKLNLSDQVLFLGQRSDIPELTGSSDVMLITSKSEGLGLSAIESLASGVPVVCADVGGLSEVVRHNFCGFLTRPGDRKEQAARIIEFFQDKELCRNFSENAIEQSRLFDINKHVRQLESIYASLESVNGCKKT